MTRFLHPDRPRTWRRQVAALLVLGSAGAACASDHADTDPSSSDRQPALVGSAPSHDTEPTPTIEPTPTTAAAPIDTEPAPTTDGPDERPSEDVLADALSLIVDDTGTPAVGAAVFTHDGLLDQAVAGVRERGDATPVTVDDAFHLGSNTKAMTASVLVRLAEHGVGIGVDTTLCEAFGDAVTVHPDYADVTLGHLLAHVGGTPTDDEIETALDIDESILTLPPSQGRAAAAALVLSAAPTVEPTTVSRYSNLGYVVVAAAMEAATGRSWEELMADQLFTPLEMSSCGFGPPDPSAEQPLGHDVDTGEPVLYENPELFAPAGGVHCSMADWGRFLVEILNAGDGSSDYLTQESVRRLLEPAAAPVEGFPDGGAAAGWLVADGPQGTAWFHDGSNTAWYSQAVVVPDIDRIVLTVANEESTGEVAAGLAFGAVTELHPA